MYMHTYYPCLRLGGPLASEKKGESEALHQASKWYEESKEQYFNAMVALQDGEDEQVEQLKAYVDAQAEFHQKCVEVLREASATLSRKAQEASSRPKHTYSPSWSATGGDSMPATSVPSYGAPSDTTAYQPAAAAAAAAAPYQAAPPEPRRAVPPPPARAAPGGQQRCSALYDFAGEASGELTFHAGDQINIIKMINAEWYAFPLPLSSSSSSHIQCKALTEASHVCARLGSQ
jgi:hypothetical protein